MEKTKILGKNLTENERKTIAAFIEIENGIPTLKKKSLKEICNKTKIYNPKTRQKKYEIKDQKKKQLIDKDFQSTDEGYQSTILKKLGGRDPRIVEKVKDGFLLKSEYLDIAHSSLIQNNIKNLEKNGFFRSSNNNSFVFGIKKSWFNYPEMHYLDNVFFDFNNIVYNIKQIKAIFLIREFSEIWKDFLELDINAPIKYWLWEIVVNWLSSYHDKSSDQKIINQQLEILSQFGISNKNEIKEYRDKIKIQLKEHYQNIRKKFKLKKIKPESTANFLFGEKVAKKLSEYNKLYTKIMLEYIENVLTKNQQKKIINIINYVTHSYPNQLNKTVLCTDIGNLSHQVNIHMKIPLDYEEKKFRDTDDRIFFKKLDKISKNLTFENIDDSFKELLDVYNERNYHRFLDRRYRVISQEIKKPKSIVFSTPVLEKIKKEIVNLVKTGECKSCISSLIDKEYLKSNNEIFSFIQNECKENLSLLDYY